MLVSVIIPLYNVESYLNRCLQSVSDQTYKNIEIILVDDGSTDNSGSMCDEFAQKDSRAVVIHKENGGVSSARNAGMAIARGDYITFLDSDDYLTPYFVEMALNLCKERKAQIAVLDMKYIKQDENEYIRENRDINVIEMNSEKAIEESLYQRLFSCCAAGKMYKKEITKDIIFPFGRLSEDLATSHLFFDEAEKIVYINEIGYFYRQRDKSIMHEFNSKRLDALEWVGEIESFCRVKYPDIVDASICRSFNVAIHLLLDMRKAGVCQPEYGQKIWYHIKRTRLKVLFDSKARARERVAAALSFFGETLLIKIWNSRFAIKRV